MFDRLVSKQSLFRHPLAAFGGALIAVGGMLFVALLLVDFASGGENPYRSLVTFVAVPAIITLGALLFLIAVRIQVMAARKAGEKVHFTLSIEPSDPKYMRNLWLFLGFIGILILVVVFSGYEAYEATDSVAFCGEVCHTVMHPQSVTYHNSAHARVLCVECHIGPGTSFWVRSKIDGARQLWATTFETYERPIETPVHNLRPARETCENCHWPQQFYGQKLLTRTYYKTDEENTPWTIKLLMKIGGGNPRTQKLEGIHWHMSSDVEIEYVANDYKRQEIPWVRVITSQGDTTVYTRDDVDEPDFEDPETVVRSFDCMDCHNRPSHTFLAPATSLNTALSTRRISPQLPSIREIGLELLNAEYETTDQALAAIEAGLQEYYQDDYPELMNDMHADIEQAVATLKLVYSENFFPEMNTDYRDRENNLSHFVNDGCYRCHDGQMSSDNGDVILHDCNACHLIVAQGASENVDELEADLNGLEFVHPEDIDEEWRETKCTECHTPDDGY